MNPDVFKNIILSVKMFEEENNIKLSRKQFNGLKMYLNRLSGKVIIDSLSFADLKDKIYLKLRNIINSKQ